MNLKIFIQAIAVIASAQPLLLLSFKGWGSGILIIAGLLSLAAIVAIKVNPRESRERFTRHERWFMAAFATPLIATLLSAIVRNDNHLAQYDSPSRFLLAIFIYVALRNSDIRINRYLQITIPIGIGTAFIYQAFNQNLSLGSGIRATSYFMDAIMFGYISLSMGLMAFFVAGTLQTENKFAIIFTLVSGALGLYLSVLSQSRTGWLAIPLIVLLYIVQIQKSKITKAKPILIAIVGLCALLSLLLYPKIKERVGQAASEISSYSFQGIPQDTSIAQRISYWRIASELIMERPFSGYGDTSRTPPDLPEGAKSYSTDFVKDTVFKVGFHNEFLATTVRSGILGAVSIISVFFIPLVIFLSKIKSKNYDQRSSAGIGCVLIMVVSISSLTIETFGLKFAASYYACMVALLAINALKEGAPSQDKLTSK